MAAKKESSTIVPKRVTHRVAPRVQMSTAHKSIIALCRDRTKAVGYKNLIVGLLQELGPIRAN